MLYDDKELHDEVEAVLEAYIRDFKAMHNNRYPSASLLATMAIDAMSDVLSQRIIKRLFGPTT